MANTVKIKKYSDVVEEYEASGTIIPGDLIEIHDDSGPKVRRHSGADQNALPMFALEDELQGKAIGDDYSAENPVQCWVAGRGDIVNARLKASEEVDIGDWLVSQGEGTLKKYNASVHSDSDEAHPLKIVGQALEASNEGTVQRIAVRIV